MRNEECMQILNFSSTTGHCVFIPSADLPRFHSHLAQMTPDERGFYAPMSLSRSQPTQGGAHYDIGADRTHSEVLQFLTHVIIDD
jgi:hypothetical protein